MVIYIIVYTEKATVDIPKPKSTKLDTEAKALIKILRENLYQTPPPYEKLVGDLQGAYSRRIDVKHHPIYKVLKEINTAKIISLWTHYEF